MRGRAPCPRRSRQLTCRTGAIVTMLAAPILGQDLARDRTAPGDDDAASAPASSPFDAWTPPGIDLEVVYWIEALANVAGGRRRDVVPNGNLDLTCTLDFERLFGWDGATGFLYGLANHGGSISEDVGDLQGVSNIEAPDAAQLFEAWLEQASPGGHVSVRVGLQDLTSEFDLIPSAALFLHSAPGTGSDFGNSGRNGPSTFPVTSLAARLGLSVDGPGGSRGRWYARFAVADGVPGEVGEAGTRIVLDEDDGLLLVGEVGYDAGLADSDGAPGHRGPIRKLAFGTWGYTGELDGFGANAGTRTGSWGVYALAEASSIAGGLDADVRPFLRLGLADERTAPFEGYVGGGVVWHGPFERPDDRLGLTVAAGRLSDDLRRASPSPEPWEVAFEGTYRLAINDHVALQPDLQCVLNPAAAPGADPAWIVGLRLLVSL